MIAFPPEAVMRLCHCPNCKQEIEPDAPICPHCAANVNQHRARDVAHLLVFAMAAAFVFTLIAALNDTAPRRADRSIGAAAQVEAGSAVVVAARATRAIFVAPPPERDATAEDDPALRDGRPKRP